MAAADVWLVASDLLQSPNAVLVAAQPPAGLPQLQTEVFGTVSMGYGDLFVAALLGAVLAAQWRRQWQAAVLDARDRGGVRPAVPGRSRELPATVPVALALLVTEAWPRRQCRLRHRRPSMRADAIPRQAR